MSQGLNIGFILPALPGFSETFIINKLNGLIQSGFSVSLFVGGEKKTNEISLAFFTQMELEALVRCIIQITDRDFMYAHGLFLTPSEKKVRVHGTWTHF